LRAFSEPLGRKLAAFRQVVIVPVSVMASGVLRPGVGF
jgi:hypothetical protein